MAYSGEKQIRDAVKVLSERLVSDMSDRRQPRIFRDALKADYPRLLELREDFVRAALASLKQAETAELEKHELMSGTRKDELKRLQAALKRANKSVSKLSGFHSVAFKEVPNLLEKVETILTFQHFKGKKRVPGFRQVHAVYIAAELITNTGEYPLTMTKTNLEKGIRGSQWFRLSAILYGDPKADLFNYMRRIKGSGAGYYRPAFKP